VDSYKVPITQAGQCVSVDQIISGTPGLFGQMQGIPTKQRYTCATIFVDHFSSLSYVHVQRSTNADETLHAMQAFEQFAAGHSIHVLHYHANNGVFANNKWCKAIDKKQQTLSFCSVNAHW
jgi:hypothetical protein